MAILFSNEFNISLEQIYQIGVFNVFLDQDSHFFINIKRLQVCTIPEFVSSYHKVNDFFREIGLLLSNAEKNDKIYNTALKKFNFPEVSGINLGFSKGTGGAGFGPKMRNKIINDAYTIIQKGFSEPELFQLVSLFEENVGPDRISDMVARIIEDNILNYSRRIYKELNINENTFSSYKFVNGIPYNPYKKAPLLLLPAEILHKLPIAKDWDDIDRVCQENEAIRREMNGIINLQWKEMTARAKKDFLFENVFLNPNKLSRIIDSYKKSKVDKYNFFEDSEYFLNFFEATINIPSKQDNIDSFQAANIILDGYKQWVENHRGVLVINPGKSVPSEKTIQRTIHLAAQLYCEQNNFDISPEADSGRGPVDFKISRGTDKTVIEVKLSSNQQCVHGLEVQTEEYAKADNTTKKIFVIINVGKGTKRIAAVRNKWAILQNAGKNPAKLVIIDAIPKKSASIY